MRQLSAIETKQILLNMLVEFDKYCDKYGLRYYLCGGALIGAIRHKGFIPWDDDIDVLMPRPDYEKLLDIEDEYRVSDSLRLFNYKKVNSRLVFSKLSNTNVPVRNKYQTEKEYVSIDIFPLDGASEDKKVNEKRYRKMNVLHNIYALHLWRPGNASKPWIRIIKSVAFPFAKLISHEYICEKMEKIATEIPFDDADYVGDILWGYGIKEIMRKEVFVPQTTVCFEGEKVKTTEAYDIYLKQTYGDYMTLPPADKRKNHELEAYMEDANDSSDIYYI